MTPNDVADYHRFLIRRGKNVRELRRSAREMKRVIRERRRLIIAYIVIAGAAVEIAIFVLR